MLRTITTTLLLTVVTTATPASAQLLRDGRLYCGAQSYDFDQVMPATESVFDLRRRDLGVLQQAVARAQTACPTSEASVPWCRGLQTATEAYNQLRRQQATACPASPAQGAEALDGPRRCVEFHRLHTASEATLLLAARRAMAHQHCQGTVVQRASACDDLIAAETAAAPEITSAMARRFAGLSQMLQERSDRLQVEMRELTRTDRLTLQQRVDLSDSQRQVLVRNNYIRGQVSSGVAGGLPLMLSAAG